MDKFKSHKIVEAAKIVHMEQVAGGDPDVVFRARCDDGVRYHITTGMIARYKPQIGDYLVKYRNNYLSISPAKEFEDGYAAVANEQRATPHGEPGPKGSATTVNPFRPVYRTLSPEEQTQLDAVKDKALELYRLFGQLPKGRGASLAQTKLEESVMWAVKGLTA